MSSGHIYRSPRDKFLRDAEREAELQAQHNTRIRYAGSYHAVCSCLWVGVPRMHRAEAERDAAVHMESPM